MQPPDINFSRAGKASLLHSFGEKCYVRLETVILVHQCYVLCLARWAQVINSLGRGNFLGPISDYVWGLLYVRDERFLIK